MASEYIYKARNNNGEIKEGILEAETRKEAARQLMQDGLYIASLKEKVEDEKEKSESIFNKEIELEDLKFWGKGFNAAELAHFTQQLYVLFNAGISLVAALGTIQKQINSKQVEKMLEDIIERIEAGDTFSSALSNHPSYFPELYTQLIRAGETGGVLDRVLEELVKYYQRRDKINKEVRSAMYYPLVILVVAIVVVFLLISIVLPTILNMLISLGGDLPLPTRLLIGLSNFTQNYWWVLLAGVILFILGMRTIIKTPRGAKVRDIIILKIPVIGDLLRKVIISRFASTMALLLDSGVTIINSLSVLEEVVGNEVYREVLEEAGQRVREGISLSEPLEKSEEFPPLVIQMIQVGEETGDLGGMLEQLSEYYDMEVQNAVEGGISLIEPTMIIILAVIVGGIVMAVILPLFDIYSTIG